MSKNQRKRRCLHLNVNRGQQVTPETGELIRVVINTKGVAPNLLTLYDGADTNSPVIATIDTSITVTTLEYHVGFKNGLYANMAGGTAADVTIIYD